MKTLIVLEMAVLIGGDIVQRLNAGDQFSEIAVHGLTRLSLAVVILLAVLLTMDELGAGSIAALFGGLIVLGYLLAAGGAIGPALENLVQNYFHS